MKVKYYFEVTSNDYLFAVHGRCCVIGNVLFVPELDLWLFKHFAIDEVIFVGDTRDEAVENYYKYVDGGKN